MKRAIDQHTPRWLPVVNTDAYPCPAYGVLEVIGLSDDTTKIRVRRPTSASLSPHRVLFAGPVGLLASGYGVAHATLPGLVLHDAAEGTLALAGSLGTKANSFKLLKGNTGFRALEATTAGQDVLWAAGDVSTMPATLENDETSPGNDQFYGTDGSGVKGWYSQSAITSSGTPGWTKISKSYTDFSTAATSNTITLLAGVAKRYVHSVIIKTTTAFDGPGLALYNLDVGFTGLPSNYVNTYDGLAAASDTNYLLNDLSGYIGDQQEMLPGATFAATDIVIRAISFGIDLDEVTDGAVDVYLLLSTLP